MAETRKGLLRALQAELAGGQPVRVVARYDTSDPFAVVLHFVGAGPGTDWVFAWDLLWDALVFASVGEGDVKFRRDLSDVECTWLTLDSPNGHAELRFRTEQLWDLAARIGRLVPPDGIEIDWDAELPALLDGGAD